MEITSETTRRVAKTAERFNPFANVLAIKDQRELNAHLARPGVDRGDLDGQLGKQYIIQRLGQGMARAGEVANLLRGSSVVTRREIRYTTRALKMKREDGEKYLRGKGMSLYGQEIRSIRSNSKIERRSAERSLAVLTLVRSKTDRLFTSNNMREDAFSRATRIIFGADNFRRYTNPADALKAINNLRTIFGLQEIEADRLNDYWTTPKYF
ncbi:MAG: hypothetical protein PHS44_06540 [Candidatus Dojkabacteria bacterium]|nr:hypothetical protein [Candidatus Dojkabacteria bacterium]